MKKQTVCLSLLVALAVANYGYSDNQQKNSEEIPVPRVLLKGNGEEISLEQQVGRSMPEEDVKNAPPQNFSAGEIGNQMTGYENQIASYNNAINKAFRKFSKEVASAPVGDKAIAYVLFKQAQQTNLLLQQQNELLRKMTVLNDNIEVLIDQNNSAMRSNERASQAQNQGNFGYVRAQEASDQSSGQTQKAIVSPAEKMPIMVDEQ